MKDHDIFEEFKDGILNGRGVNNYITTWDERLIIHYLCTYELRFEILRDFVRSLDAYMVDGAHQSGLELIKYLKGKIKEKDWGSRTAEIFQNDRYKSICNLILDYHSPHPDMERKISLTSGTRGWCIQLWYTKEVIPTYDDIMHFLVKKFPREVTVQ